MKIVYESNEEPLVSFVEKSESWTMKNQHYHSSMEIYLLTEGDRKITVNGQTEILRAGDMAIIKPYALHYTQKNTSELMTRYLISISKEMFCDLLKKEEIERLFGSVESGIVRVEDKMLDAIVRHWRYAAQYYKMNDALKVKIGRFYVIQLLMLINDMQAKPHTVFAFDNGLDGEMINIIKFIHSRFRDADFGFGMVLEYSHMSKSRFCKVFKENFHTTFSKYVNILRITAVKNDLRESDKPIDIIAEENGYISIQTMTRNFIEEFGVSPARFRKGLKNQTAREL